MTITGLFEIEAVAGASLCAIACWQPTLAEAFWQRLENRVRRVTPPAALLAAFVAPLLVRLALLHAVHLPKPAIMDEFSYLLGGETFAMGRVVNPPLPVPEAFRVLYILNSPAYVSMYLPAQSMVLAFGKVVFGHPWWGVFFSIGLMGASAFWMARAFVPVHWALLGALLTGLQLGPFTYWMNSYWGGAVAAIGGNLAMGAYGRLRTRLAAGPTLAFAVGAMVLGMCRPFEGLVLVAALAGLLAHDVITRQPRPGWPELGRFLVPLASGALVFFMAMAWYNTRTTGDWRVSPYVRGNQEASGAPLLLLQPLGRTPDLPDNLQRFDVGFRLATYRRALTLPGHLRQKIEQFESAAEVYVRPSLIPPLLLGLLSLWRFRLWKLAVVLAAGAVATLAEIYGQPHYQAPFVALYCLLLILGLKMLRGWEPRGRPIGLALSRALFLTFAGAILLTTISLLAGVRVRPTGVEFGCCASGIAHPRDKVEAALNARPAKSLVLVRYGSYNYIHYEWVYNSADVSGAKVIWARDLGPSVTQELIRHYPGRDLWYLDVGFQRGQASLHLAPNAAQASP